MDTRAESSLLRRIASAILRAAAGPFLADSYISIRAGRPTIYTFPIAFPIILIAILLGDWWRSRHPSRRKE